MKKKKALIRRRAFSTLGNFGGGGCWGRVKQDPHETNTLRKKRDKVKRKKEKNAKILQINSGG